MKTIEKRENDVWYVAHNHNDVFHFGFLQANAELKTGQPYLENFNTEDEMSERLSVLTGDTEYYKKYLESIKNEEDNSDYDEYADFDPTLF